MAQIVRDRTRHPPDRRQPFGIQEFALRSLEVLSHAVEGSGHFRNFVAPTDVQRYA